MTIGMHIKTGYLISNVDSPSSIFVSLDTFELTPTTLYRPSSSNPGTILANLNT